MRHERPKACCLKVAVRRKAAEAVAGTDSRGGHRRRARTSPRAYALGGQRQAPELPATPFDRRDPFLPRRPSGSGPCVEQELTVNAHPQLAAYDVAPASWVVLRGVLRQ